MDQMKKFIVSALAFTVFGTGILGVKADSVGGGTGTMEQGSQDHILIIIMRRESTLLRFVKDLKGIKNLKVLEIGQKLD